MSSGTRSRLTKKTGGEKSRDTVPLSSVQFRLNYKLWLRKMQLGASVLPPSPPPIKLQISSIFSPLDATVLIIFYRIIGLAVNKYKYLRIQIGVRYYNEYT